MRDIALDTTTGDLAVSAGRLSLTVGVPAVCQRLGLRLSLWRGEYVIDRGQGIPYTDILGRKGTEPILEATLRRAAGTSPGIDTLQEFSMDVDAERAASVSLVARASNGEPVRLDAFRVAA